MCLAPVRIKGCTQKKEEKKRRKKRAIRLEVHFETLVVCANPKMSNIRTTVDAIWMSTCWLSDVRHRCGLPSEGEWTSFGNARAGDGVGGGGGGGMIWDSCFLPNLGGFKGEDSGEIHLHKTHPHTRTTIPHPMPQPSPSNCHL